MGLPKFVEMTPTGVTERLDSGSMKGGLQPRTATGKIVGDLPLASLASTFEHSTAIAGRMTGNGAGTPFNRWSGDANQSGTCHHFDVFASQLHVNRQFQCQGMLNSRRSRVVECPRDLNFVFYVVNSGKLLRWSLTPPRRRRFLNGAFSSNKPRCEILQRLLNGRHGDVLHPRRSLRCGNNMTECFQT